MDTSLRSRGRTYLYAYALSGEPKRSQPSLDDEGQHGTLSAHGSAPRVAARKRAYAHGTGSDRAWRR